MTSWRLLSGGAAFFCPKSARRLPFSVLAGRFWESPAIGRKIDLRSFSGIGRKRRPRGLVSSGVGVFLNGATIEICHSEPYFPLSFWARPCQLLARLLLFEIVLPPPPQCSCLPILAPIRA